MGFHRELTVENGRRKIVIGMVGGNIERLYQGHNIEFTVGEGMDETKVVIVLERGVIEARKRITRGARSEPRDAG
jgi:hypothetical protein